MININIAEAKKLNGQYSAFLSFPYDNRLVETIRSFPFRSWNNEHKTWEIPLDKVPEFIKECSYEEVHVSGPYLDLGPKKAEVPDGFEFKTKPFNHQVEGFEFGLEHDRWLLGDEQGLGKTKQVIDIAIAKKLMFNYKHCLIVCGVNGLKWNWLNEIHTHSNEEAYILGQYISRGKILIGSNKKKLEDTERLDQINEYFIITNVETLRDEQIGKELQKKCKEGIINIVAIDEIHKCKNPSSQQGKGILKLQAECRIAMTGTPLMNTPMDLYIILKWLGYENHAFYAFKKHYCIMGGYGGYEIVGYQNLEELKQQLDEIMLRRLKVDVLDLPEKLPVTEYVEMTPKQAEIYKEIKADIKANIDQIKMASNPLAELIRMRQATGYTGILSSTVRESAKLDRMEELVEEAIGNGKKVVIFSNWTQMTDIIRNRLRYYKPAVITGQIDDAVRQRQVYNFQNDDDCKVIVGTTGAMGTGLTLTAGTVEIFVDEPWNKALKDQAEDRCHRVGTTQNITIYTILCKNTIDERIHELIEQKGEMADAIVDGKINVKASELLDYLID